MSEQSRDRIFARLSAGSRQPSTSVPQPEPMPVKTYNRTDKIEKLKTLMEAMRTEVHITSAQNWIHQLEEILKKRELKSLVYPPQTTLGDTLESHWENDPSGLPQLIPYEKKIEDFKDRLFTIDAGITSTAGAIADPGALILWPSEKEPRLMSLVPSIHIAVLEADKIFSSFLEAMQKEKWSTKMPTNVVLISGPSKTADIEMTLAFGVHGPRELIVLILES
ncbi:MAG: lactate utilization protein [Proteobacteria bacterium]|nr:lactate utilization protein [Pseudomonadota bacterium]